MPASPPLQGLRILVVEDDYLIALVLLELLQVAGAEVIGPLGWVKDALAVVTDVEQRLDAAVLDVNLHGEKSYPIAEALKQRAIKFVFATGYGAEALEVGYQSCPRCEKPFNPDMLIGLLSKLQK
jgi:CheY-like chemotaxis protein